MKARLAKICPLMPFALILAINLLASCNKTSLEDQIYDCFSLLSKKNRGFLKSVICGRIKLQNKTPYHKKDYRHEQI